MQNSNRDVQHAGAGQVTPVLRAALIAAGLLSASASAFGQIQTASELFVDVDATGLADGPVATIPNKGTLGGVFEARGGEANRPSVGSVGGTKAMRFDGTDFLQLVPAAGGAVVPPPAGLVGEEPTRSIEVWTLNPEVGGEETLVSWAKRGGPDGSNISFGYGSDFRWGAMGHWGNPDLGWDNSGGNPTPNKWHHLVYTFDGPAHTTRVYVDGLLRNAEVVPAGLINTHPDTAINIATQLESDGTTQTTGLRYTGAIARVRIHDGVLTPEQVLANYNTEKSAFIDPLPPSPIAPERLAKAPMHRYTFSETAGDAADQARITDSAGTAHGVVQGTGARFSGSRLVLPGGPSSEAPFGDLPNGLLSKNGASNGGSGQFALELWAKITGARTWSRFFDIGSTTSDDGTGEVIGVGLGGTGLDYLEYSAQIGDDVNSRRLELRNEDPAGGGVTTADVGTRTFNTDTHVLVTWDEKSGAINLYENGSRIGGMTVDDALSDINDVNVWLGRSNWSGDQNTQGEFDEVRIYDVALTPGQALGNYLAGPDLLNNTDTPARITRDPVDLTVPETLSATFSAAALGSTPLSYQWNRNGVAIPGATSANYTREGVTAADNGAVFTVDVINSVGGAEVKATSKPARLTVVSDTLALKHRYGFNENAGTTVADAVGGKHGTVMGNGTFGAGQLTLDGQEGSYVDLPNGIITALGDNATFEVWVTHAPAGPAWARIFDFGTSTGGEDVSDGGGDVDTLFLTSRSGDGIPRFEANFPGGGTLTGLNHPGSMPEGVQDHVVITYSATGNTARMFTNGTLVASSIAPKKISELAGRDVNNWLGRSQYADPYWAGKYNEVRLYSGAMTPAQVAASYAAGPDALPAARPVVSVSRNGNEVVVTFSGALQSADTVTGPWTDVPGSGSVAVPAAGAARYFRAKQP